MVLPLLVPIEVEHGTKVVMVVVIVSVPVWVDLILNVNYALLSRRIGNNLRDGAGNTRLGNCGG